MRHRKTACFGALVLEPHFDQILRPLLATLLSPWLAEFAASIILFEDAKCEIAALSNTCGRHMILSQDDESSGNFAIFPLSMHSPYKGGPTLPKIMPMSDPKNKPKTSPFARLSWKCCSCLCCRDVDKRCPMYWKLIRASKACNRGVSRPSEAWPWPRLGRREAHGNM